MKLVNIKEFEKNLETNIDPYEIPGAMDALYDAMEDFDLVRCKDCKHSKEWYRDRLMCHLWAEFGVSVFEDGFCNYGERSV